MLSISEEMLSELQALTRRLPTLAHFFRRRIRRRPLALSGFRVEAEDHQKALKLGKHHLAGFIDALSILLDRELPEVSSVVQVREVGNANVEFYETSEQGWAYFNPADPVSTEAWRTRCKSVFEALFPFFDIAAGLHPRRDTSLSRQLLYSLKMYRHGAATALPGIEFML